MSGHGPGGLIKWAIHFSRNFSTKFGTWVPHSLLNLLLNIYEVRNLVICLLNWNLVCSDPNIQLYRWRRRIRKLEDPQFFENYIKTNKQKYNIFIFRGWAPAAAPFCANAIRWTNNTRYVSSKIVSWSLQPSKNVHFGQVLAISMVRY